MSDCLRPTVYCDHKPFALSDIYFLDTAKQNAPDVPGRSRGWAFCFKFLLCSVSSTCSQIVKKQQQQKLGGSRKKKDDGVLKNSSI